VTAPHLDAPPVELPATERTAAWDVAAIVVAWAGVSAGLVAKLAFSGWATVAVIVLFPVTIVLPFAGAFAVTSALRARGERRTAPRPRAVFRALGWVVGLGVLVAYGCLPDGGDDDATQHSLLLALTGGATSPDWVGTLAWWAFVVAAAAAAAAVVLRVVGLVRLRRAARART